MTMPGATRKLNACSSKPGRLPAAAPWSPCRPCRFFGTVVLYKEFRFRDDPPSAAISRLEAPFGLEEGRSANQPETHEVYRDWRKIADSYSPPQLLLETWVGDLSRMANYYGHDDELQLARNLPFMFADFTVQALARVVAETLAALPADACPVWTASNHDISRFPSRNGALGPWAGVITRSAS
jgi:alpha-glucosidase